MGIDETILEIKNDTTTNFQCIIAENRLDAPNLISWQQKLQQDSYINDPLTLIGKYHVIGFEEEQFNTLNKNMFHGATHPSTIFTILYLVGVVYMHVHPACK